MFSKADPSILQSKQRTVSYIVYDEADMILTQKLNNLIYFHYNKIINFLLWKNKNLEIHS